MKNFQVTRDADRRNATLTWTPQKDCQGYNIRWGISPDKLYHSWLVYHQDRLEIRSLNIDQPYYFAVEGFNENGISPLTETVKIE